MRTVKTIFNLPAHPLFVHAPIVLLPLLAIVTIVAAVRPVVARRIGYWLPVAAVLVFVSIIMAMNSGEALDDALRADLGDIARKHRHLAETTRLLAFGMLVATAALWWVTRRRTSDEGPGTVATSLRSPVVMGVGAIVVVLSALSTVWVIRTGHEGARIHWSGVIKPAAKTASPTTTTKP